MSTGRGLLDRLRAARDAARRREAARMADEQRYFAQLSDQEFADVIPAVVTSLGHDAALRMARDRLARMGRAQQLSHWCVQHAVRLQHELLDGADELQWLSVEAVRSVLAHPLRSAILFSLVLGLLFTLMG